MPNTAAACAQAVREQLDRILASPPFSKTERGREFLRYIVEQTLQGKANEIKEYSIAVEVFGRPPTYDPHVDATVRVEAGRLRDRLRQYYDQYAGASELRIELPTGSYVPVLTHMSPRRWRVLSWRDRSRHLGRDRLRFVADDVASLGCNLGGGPRIHYGARPGP